MTYPEKGARVGSVAAGAFGRGTGSPGGAVDRAESFSCGPRVRRVREGGERRAESGGLACPRWAGPTGPGPGRAGSLWVRSEWSVRVRAGLVQAVRAGPSEPEALSRCPGRDVDQAGAQ